MKYGSKILNVIIVLLVTISFGVVFVNAKSNPYNEKGPYGTNCTWYAWKMANEKAGVSLPGWGNAKEWYNDAKEDGYSVGTTPKGNSIIVWGTWTSYGHVGYVEKVEGNILHIWDSASSCVDEESEEFKTCIANSVSEQTDTACYQNAKKIACEYTISPDEYGITGYIYLDNPPKKETTSKPQNNSNSNNNESTTNKTPVKSSNAKLKELVLSNGDIEFDKDVYEYSIEVENEVDAITINASTDHKLANVKGTGDYELNVGLNEIKLIVTAEDKSTKEYVVKVTRNEKIEEEKEELPIELEKETPKSENDNQKTILLVVGIALVMVLFGTIIAIYKKKHSKK